MSFSQQILGWYQQNKRDLPWRKTQEPYHIWLSEIMLQQTRVAQGMPYYQAFTEKFPTIFDLANATEEEVLKLWQGLGYYSRARNLHFTAKYIANTLNGVFPDNYKELIKLKGVGDYTASAIASFCFNEATPVVDGNVYRVLSRYFGIDTPINSTEGVAYFKKLATEVMDANNIGNYNQGIMEFGAIQCAPKKPNCMYCPLQDSCVAVQQGKTQELPVKLKKGKVKQRFFNYLVVEDAMGNTILQQRTGKGIWQNMYEFLLVETPAIVGEKELRVAADEVLKAYALDDVYKVNTEVIVHKLSHQHLNTNFWVAKTSKVLTDGLPWNEVKSFPVPVLVAEFIKTFKI